MNSFMPRFIRRMEELLDLDESELALARSNTRDSEDNIRTSRSSNTSLVEV